ncbi:GPI inositol-deacylase-like isoform X3 [Mytilus californianus]|uniref:GPI inositol-deacylase-like isoform X3 n=1 Tax=Mytilus californianus TaxID=6549 RepID=UPI0022474810|nr:GPI inositol-deacylase-like isoform X3 [Mytilus californianus]
MVSPGKIGYCLVCVGIIVYGIWDYLSNFEQNKCLMTYMFEMPEYIQLPLGKRLKENYPRYRLFIYGEGQYARKLESKRKVPVNGVPVLFIPGNAGSYRQARSLASVAHRRANDKRFSFHFNYFTIDFNEELSALYGGMLQSQTEFVHECVKKILSLYESNKPTSVVLVGHSMGGMIARALFTLPEFDQNSVNTIITQATPHQAPVISLDRMIATYYSRVNNYWRTHSNTTLKHVTVVSTGGGYRDVLVRNELTSLRGIADPDLSISTSTMSVPNAWVSTDHLCAVWCKQMVMLTKRAMFDIIDPATLQVTINTNERMNVFKHHFLSNPGTKKIPEYWRDEILLYEEIPWVVKKEKTWEFAKKRVLEDYYYAVPMDLEDVNSFVAISNVDLQDWICICKIERNEERCKTCKSLSQKGKIIPPFDSYRKIIHIDYKDYPEMTHVVLIITSGPNQVEVMGDSYNKDYRHLSYKLPSVPDILMTYPESVTKGVSVLTLYNDSLFYNLQLKGLDSVLRAYTAKLVPKHCTSNKDLHEGNMMSLHVPWSQEDVYSFSRLNEIGNLSIKLQSLASPVEDNNESVELRIYKDPTCSYQLKIIASPTESLGQFIRFYGKLFPSFMLAIVLMGLVFQLHQIRRERKCPDIIEAIASFGAPFKILPVVVIFRFILNNESFEGLITRFGLPQEDGRELTKSGLYSATLPLMLYIISLGVVNVHCYLLIMALNIISKVAAVLFGWIPSLLFTFCEKIKVILLILAILTSCILCGSLGIIISYICFVLQLARLCHLARVLKHRNDTTKFNLGVTILLIYLWVVALSFPASISWAKNMRYTFILPDDSNKLMSVLSVLSISCLVVLDNPISARESYLYVAPAVYVVNVLLLLYGMVSLYRIVYAVTSVLLGLAVTRMVYYFKHGQHIDIGQDKSD